MLERELTIVNKLGLHARAAAKVVNLLSGYKSLATLECRGRAVNAKSIMLAAGQGTRLTLKLEGPDADEALAAAEALFANGFDEQD